MNIYDFKAEKNDGNVLSFDDFKGKVLLIVNAVTVFIQKLTAFLRQGIPAKKNCVS